MLSATNEPFILSAVMLKATMLSVVVPEVKGLSPTTSTHTGREIAPKVILQ
jgi:hypothetical protein